MGGGYREIWLVRHGETAANVRRVIQGQTDTPLNERGREQAEKLGAHLASLPSTSEPFSAVLSSPLSRAAGTAEALAAALELEVTLEDRLMERSFGVLEGEPVDEVYATQDAAGGDPYAFRPEGGESTHEMGARACAALDEWSARDDAGGRLLIVSHGGPISAMLARALGLALTRENVRAFRRDNTGVSVLERTSRGHMRVRVMNARPHLGL
jgi:probable phosphoglycerate mutase